MTEAPEVSEFNPFIEEDVAEIVAPETPTIESGEQQQEDIEDGTGEAQDTASLAPEKKKNWGERERDKRIEVESQLSAERERIHLIEYQNKQLQKAVDEMLKGKQLPANDDAAIDKLFRDHDIDPEAVMDREGLAATLRAAQGNTEQVQQMRNQMVADSIKSSIATAQATNPDFTNAFTYYAERKFNDAKVAVEQLGYDMDDNQIRDAVVQEAQKILLAARERGKDPATVLFNLAKTSGYKPSAAKTPLKEEINYDKLQELRDSASKPAYSPKSAQFSETVEDDWVMTMIS